MNLKSGKILTIIDTSKIGNEHSTVYSAIYKPMITAMGSTTVRTISNGLNIDISNKTKFQEIAKISKTLNENQFVKYDKYIIEQSDVELGDGHRYL